MRRRCGYNSDMNANVDMLAEQHDEWAVSRRYMSADSLAAAAHGSLRLEPSEELDEDAVSPLLEAAVA